MILNIDESLDAWGSTLCREIDIGSLWSRNRTAHKWRITYFSLLLRECVAWRMQDLLTQARHLQKHGMTLGSAVLIRSSVETIAVLIYQNALTESLISGKTSFKDYSDRIRKLAIGSRDRSTPAESINIMTILKKAEIRHPQLMDIYNRLSEVAHPNHDGVLMGYSTENHPKFVTQLSNRWRDTWDTLAEATIALVISIFFIEYNTEWTNSFEKLEAWLVDNDALLESQKPAPE